MKHILKKDLIVFIKNRFIGSEREHTNIAKLDQSRIVKETSMGVNYQLKEGDIVIFDRTNDWDISYYKTPCNGEFSISCGYDWFSKNN